MDVLKYLPAYNKEVELLMKNGDTRLGYYHGGGCFFFTDCTHPLQNINCPYYYVSDWRYVNKNEDPLNVMKNIWERMREGEEILQSVKSPTILERIKYLLSKLLLSITVILFISCSQKVTSPVILRSDTTQSVFYPDSLHVIIFYDDGYKDKRIGKQ